MDLEKTAPSQGGRRLAEVIQPRPADMPEDRAGVGLGGFDFF